MGKEMGLSQVYSLRCTSDALFGPHLLSQKIYLQTHFNVVSMTFSVILEVFEIHAEILVRLSVLFRHYLLSRVKILVMRREREHELIVIVFV
jgi:hypothetical protein